MWDSIQLVKDGGGDDLEWRGKTAREANSECVKNVNLELIVSSSIRAEGIRRSNWETVKVWRSWLQNIEEVHMLEVQACGSTTVLDKLMEEQPIKDNYT